MLSIFLLAVGVVLFVLLLKEKAATNNLEMELAASRERVHSLEAELAYDDPRKKLVDKMYDSFIKEVVQKLPGFGGNVKEYHNEGATTVITSNSGKTVFVEIGACEVSSNPSDYFTWLNEEQAIIACGGTPKKKGKLPPEYKSPIKNGRRKKAVEEATEEPKEEAPKDELEVALSEFYKVLNEKLLTLVNDPDGHITFDIPVNLSSMKDQIWEHITQNEYCVGENNTSEPGQYIVISA